MLSSGTEIRLNKDERIEALVSIQSNGHHLLTLINEIPDLAKVESGKMDILLET